MLHFKILRISGYFALQWTKEIFCITCIPSMTFSIDFFMLHMLPLNLTFLGINECSCLSSNQFWKIDCSRLYKIGNSDFSLQIFNSSYLSQFALIFMMFWSYFSEFEALSAALNYIGRHRTFQFEIFTVENQAKNLSIVSYATWRANYFTE